MKNKLVPLDMFFESILYHKKKGYYNKLNPFGLGGDFITSPGISNIFSEIIAICSAAQYMNTTVKAHKIPALDNNMNEASVKMMIQKGYQGLAEYMINRRK